LFVCANEWLVGLFVSIPEVVRYAADCLRYIAYCYGFLGASLALSQAMNGAGDTWTPTWINFIAFWVLQLPLAYGLAIAVDMGPHGVFTAITLAAILVAALAYWQFRQGRWARTSV
jgi:Na+-driven multidrug efflux pump